MAAGWREGRAQPRFALEPYKERVIWDLGDL